MCYSNIDIITYLKTMNNDILYAYKINYQRFVGLLKLNMYSKLYCTMCMLKN